MIEKNLPKTYRKKPVDIKALQWTGYNYVDICLFMGRTARMSNDGQRILMATLEGEMAASIGDYIIRGIRGEFYPCKPDIFLDTYEEVTE